MVEVGWADWKVLAVAVVTASLILSGIFIGIGRAFNNRRLERFGIEESIQSIINSALLGAIVVIETSISTIGSGFFIEKKCGEGEVAAEWVGCIVKNLADAVFAMLQESIKILTTIGYYQELTLNFNVFAIKPLVNLSAISSMLTTQINLAQIAIILLNLNLQILNFIVQSGFPLLFAAGLIFRAFFATRKLGGFLIALSLGLFIFYPIIMMMFHDPISEVNSAVTEMKKFTNSSMYAPWPILDLNNNYAIAAKLDNLSGWGANSTANIASDLTIITRKNAEVLSNVANYAIIGPLFSLIVTIVFIKELGNILGGEIEIPIKTI